MAAKVAKEMKMRLLALGENVCDLYLSRGMMYPGGQCANTAVYAAMRGVFSAYMGVFGSDHYAEVCRGGLEAFGVDLSHCRSVEGENGYCRIEHRGTDRVFAGSNRFGVNRTQPLELTAADWDYIRTFDVIYTDCNGQVDRYLPELAKTGIPVAYDFSAKIADEDLVRVAPYVAMASLSCADTSAEERERKMHLMASHGTPMVLTTVGEAGSYLLSGGQLLYAPAAPADMVVDTLGAGDAYFAALICEVIQGQPLQEAMEKAAAFAADILKVEGAYGHGIPMDAV